MLARLGCPKILDLWQGVCRAFRNSSSDSCRSAWGVHAPQLERYRSELCFTRLLSEPYMPTAGTRSGNRIGTSRAGFRRSRQRSPVWRRQYGRRVDITQRTVGRDRTSQYSEELQYSGFRRRPPSKARAGSISERDFLRRIAMSCHDSAASRVGNVPQDTPAAEWRRSHGGFDRHRSAHGSPASTRVRGLLGLSG
jgi:hypothetical protein